MTPLGVTALMLAAVLGTLIMWWINQPAVVRTITVANKLRWAFGLLLVALSAYHFRLSGNPYLITLAILGAAFLTGYFLVERPWEETI